MLFNSLTFVVFFLVVLAAYWSMRSWEARKNLLLVASYIFYGAWNPPFAALLFATTALDFYLGRKMGNIQTSAERRVWLVISVAVNLSMLGFFKYGNFLLENFEWVLARGGIQYKPPHLDVFLPIGISFYTFHSLSYTLDIYRGVMRPTRSLRDFTLAVSFFPQLVAGPIVRAGDFLPQLEQPPQPQQGRFLWGLFLMTLGLFEKVVLADTMLSGAADRVFGHGGPLVALDSWTGVIAFAGQIFFDFAGYSTCAIGAALCLGFHLKDNFRFPYAAIGFSDFWRRWHISLSTCLRDYVYIPLGGNRRGEVRAYYNLTVTMLIGGLWHGANWTFVVWGAYHGFLLALHRRFAAQWDSLPRAVKQPLMFLLVIVGWVFFRSTEFGMATSILRAMFTPTLGVLVPQPPLVIFALLLAAWWSMIGPNVFEMRHSFTFRQRAIATVAFAVCLALIMGTRNSPFLYFQF
jgi:alginate O-acetyltransferase complex protein AlgI